MARFVNAFRMLSIRIGNLLVGPRPQVIRPTGIPSEERFGEPTIRVGDIEVPDDIPLAEQIRLLLRRVEHVENVARTDRQQAQQRDESLRAELAAAVDRLNAADARIEGDARRMSLGSARLQMWGLVLVGIGTALMTWPAL